MEFLSKSESKTYFNENEKNFLGEIFSFLDENDPDKINIDSLKIIRTTDKNTIESTKEKLDTIIKKYNLGKIVELFKNYFIPSEISNELSTTFKNDSFNNNIKNSEIILKPFYSSTKLSAMTSNYAPPESPLKIRGYKGGHDRGGKIIVKLLFENINSHGIISGTMITFVELILIIILSIKFIDLLNSIIADGTLMNSFRIINKKIVNFYYRLRFLILNETIVVENYREIIALPNGINRTLTNDINRTTFSGNTQNAVLIPRNIEDLLNQRLNNLLVQYNRSEDYRIYSNLTLEEQNNLIIEINQIENELADLLQPAELIPIENVSNENVSNDNFDARNDIVAAPVSATDETKDIFKFFLRFCLIGLFFLTTGGRTKTRKNKRKTNNKNKKRKTRTKRNKRNSRSV